MKLLLSYEVFKIEGAICVIQMPKTKRNNLIRHATFKVLKSFSIHAIKDITPICC